MYSQRFRATLSVLVLWTCLGSSVGWPVSESTTVAPARKFLKSSVVTSVSVVTKQNGPKSEGVRPAEVNRAPGVNLYRLPPSPANLLKPDRFQFYTYNERGDMITKQMTMQEIQALIASGGPDHSNTGIQEPQKAEDILTGGKKVMDVVEKVQNVLKSAMGKPPTLMGSISTVPEKANAEWSNILPAILAGDKYSDKIDDENHRVEPVTPEPMFASTVPISFKPNRTGIVPIVNTFDLVQQKEETDHQIDGGNKMQEALPAVTVDPTTTFYTEKIMIPVPVITAEHKPQTTQIPVTQSPVFQKITEMMPLAGALENDQVEKKNVSLASADVGVPDASTPSILMKDKSDITEAVSVTLQSVTEKAVTPSITVVKTELPIADTKTESVNTNEPTLDDGFTSKPVSILETSKPDTSVTTEAVMLSSQSSTVFIASTDEPKVSQTELPTTVRNMINTNDFESTTQLSKPLSQELADSLSSMLNQVSDISGPSLLPVSSGLELPLQETIMEKNKNGSEASVSTILMPPPIVRNESVNVDDTLKERTEESSIETMTDLKTDEEPVSATTLATLVSTSVSTSTANVGEITNYPDNLVKSNVTLDTSNSQVEINATTISSEEILNNTSNLSSSVLLDQTRSPVTTEVMEEITPTLNPLDSPTMNLTHTTSNSSIKVGNEQSSNLTLVGMIDSILQTVPPNVNPPITQSLNLPNTSVEDLPMKTIASGLIAGFGSTDLQKAQDSLQTTTSTSENYSPTDSTASKFETPTSTSATPVVTEILQTNKTLGPEKGMSKKENETQSISTTDSLKTWEPSVPEREVSGTTDSIASVTTTSIEKTQLEKETSSIASITPSVTPSVTIKDTVTDRSELHSTQETPVKLNNENSQQPEQESKFNITIMESNTPDPASRLERVPEEVLKKDDETLAINSTNFVSTSTTERIEATILDSTTIKEELTSNNRSTVAILDSVNKSTTEGLLKEQLEPRKNETLVIGEETRNTTVIDGIKSPNITEGVPSTTVRIIATETEINSSNIDTTTNVSPLVRESSEENNTIANGIDSLNTMDHDFLSKNATAVRPQNEEQGTTTQKPSDSAVTQSLNKLNKTQANQTLDSRNSTVSKLNTTGDNDSEHKWQRIPLRQTTPSSITKLITTSKKPLEAISVATTQSTIRAVPTQESTSYQSVTPPSETQIVSLDVSKNEVSGLDSSTRNASIDVVNFSRFCNELAFKFWIAANKGLSTGRSLALSPFGMVSLLAMIFLGARGPTSEQMNEILGLDNVATFNPHLIFQNVTDAVSLARHQGIANAAFVRELFADKTKVRKLLPFYKEQAQQFYEGLVTEVNFATISDLARRRTNLLIRKQTGGRIKDFVKSNAVPLRSPLAAISANVFQTDCNASSTSTAGRDGELYFAVSSAHRLRKLIPVPAAVWRMNVLAGYEPSVDATVVALGGINKLVSTIFLLPGQQGHVAPGDTLDRLEQRLVKGASRGDGTWNKLLRVLIPRPGLELQIPKFSHRSVVNATAALKRMGLDQLFSNDADLKGINGIGNRLFLSDVLQMNLFSTCGDENIANGRHHVEIYPASPTSRNSQFVEPSSKDTEKQTMDAQLKNYRTISIQETTRNYERSEDKPRLKLDQPFLYFVRHNPTGLILHMGRFNPRSL